MAARVPLEKGDWAAAAAFPAPDSRGPSLPRLSVVSPAPSAAARSGDPAEARTEIAALDSLAVRPGRKRTPTGPGSWNQTGRGTAPGSQFASGDTGGGLALRPRAAADTEEVTDKHPVTPPSRCRRGSCRPTCSWRRAATAEAREAYSNVGREVGRARSLFGAARAAQLAGDKRNSPGLPPLS